MTQTPFINVDCQWLDELGQTFIDDGDLQTGMRLRAIAQRFQSLDQRLLTLSANGEFAAGRESVYQELMAHSNLPPEFHAHKQKPGLKPVIDPTKVRKIPTGMTSEQLKAKELMRQVNAKREAAKSEKFAGLSGLKLNLEVLKK